MSISGSAIGQFAERDGDPGNLTCAGGSYSRHTLQTDPAAGHAPARQRPIADTV